MTPTQTIHEAGEDILPGLALSIIVRTSPRARNMLIRLLPGTGIEVVLPRGVPHTEARALLMRKRGWIERGVARMTAQGADFTGHSPALPDSLTLPAIDLTFAVRCLDRPGPLRLTENAGRLTLSGSQDDRVRVFRRLKEFVRVRAKVALPPLLRDQSRETGLDFDEVQVRCQKSRWGSCSRRLHQATISLNAKLLFLPPDLCGQVLLHELCHLRQPNHSPAFWALVTSFNPRARDLERQLAAAWRFVPPWWNAAQ